jgi:dienelactone hydrolase
MATCDEQDCCPVGSLPSLTPSEEYVTKGEVILLGDLPAYVVGSRSASHAVIVGYDIYGFNGGRIRNICDEIASHGYLVVLPDYFRGDCWTQLREQTEQDDKMPFIKRYITVES